MADDSSGDNVAEFCTITGSSVSDARRYLENAGYDFDLAISSYYEYSELDDDENLDVTSSGEAAQPPKANVESKKPVKTTSSTQRFATLANLGTDEGASSDEEGQAFYAGGSVRSGQQVLGPNKGKKNNDKIVEDMFRSAKSHGAKEKEPESHRLSARLQAFQGTGHVLGATMDENEVQPSSPGGGGEEPPYQVVLRAWRNGFSIDDGPLQDYHDPANKEFLDAVYRGDIPPDLIRTVRASGTTAKEVTMSIEDHRYEDYARPKQVLKAFHGQGHRLGSPTPAVCTSLQSEDKEKTEGEAQEALQIDFNAPVCQIQLRLPDGSRLIAKFNHSHTVGDIRRYIITARPEYSASVFSLMTMYPQQELSDDSATLAEANLLNSVIFQKLQ